MSEDINTDEPQQKMCERCGMHPDDLKCLDEFIGDQLRPIQTGLSWMLNDETLPHAVRGEIVEAADALGRAMQAAKDCMPNATNDVRRIRHTVDGVVGQEDRR